MLKLWRGKWILFWVVGDVEDKAKDTTAPMLPRDSHYGLWTLIVVARLRAGEEQGDEAGAYESHLT